MAYDEGDLRTTRGLISNNADERSTIGLIFTGVIDFIRRIPERVASTARASVKAAEEYLQKIRFVVYFLRDKFDQTYTINKVAFDSINVLVKDKIIQEEINNISVSCVLTEQKSIPKDINVTGKIL